MRSAIVGGGRPSVRKTFLLSLSFATREAVCVCLVFKIPAGEKEALGARLFLMICLVP
jgi:hypothetical protein